MTTGTFLAIAFGILVVIAFANPRLRRKFVSLIGIKTEGALDAATNPVERMKFTHRELVSQAEKQKAAVQRVMAQEATARKDHDLRKQETEGLKAKYNTAKNASFPESALNTIAKQYSESKAALKGAEDRLSMAVTASDEARSALESTNKELQKMAATIQDAAAKAELAKAIKTSNDVTNSLDSIRGKGASINEDAAAIDRTLEEARAGQELNKGSKEDQELKRLEAELAARQAREELDGLTGGQ